MAYSKQKTFLELTQLLIRSLSSDHVWMERSYCIPILVILLCVSASMFNQAGLKARLDGFQDKKQSVSECLAFAPSLDSHRFAWKVVLILPRRRLWSFALDVLAFLHC